MRTVRSDTSLDPTFTTTQNKKEAGGMRSPHRRDISARQDLLGRELRDLFDGYTQEDVPDELMRLAEQLQSAFEQRAPEPRTAGEDDPDGARPGSEDSAD